MKRAVYALLAVIFGLCAWACHRGAPAVSAPLTLRIAVPAPPVEMPGAGMANLISALTNESLLGTAPDGRQTPRIAENWSWDATRTVLTLSLRQNAYFHNGAPLDAASAAESLKKSVRDQEGIGLSRVVAVESTGPFTLQIKLKDPDSFLLPELAITSIRLTNPDVGLGPFVLTSSGDQEVVLTAFDKYFRGRPTVRRVTLKPYPTQRSAWAAMMRGETDMLHDVSSDAIDFVQAETAVKTYSFPRPYYYVLAFNLRHPVLGRPEVRRALNQAVNKDALVADGLHGRGRPATDPIWPDYWTASTASNDGVFNPEAAKQALDAAGLTVKQAAGEMPRRFTFTTLVFAGDNRVERMALILQKQLFDIGVDMKLEPVSGRELGPRAQKHDFDAFLFEMANARTLSWVYNFWHSPSADAPTYNYTGYTAADQVLDRIRLENSEDQLRADTGVLQNVFRQDPPAVFISWQSQTRAVSAKFAIPTEPGRDIISTVWQWTIASPQQTASR